MPNADANAETLENNSVRTPDTSTVTTPSTAVTAYRITPQIVLPKMPWRGSPIVLLAILVVIGQLSLTRGALWDRYILSPRVRCTARLALMRFDSLDFDRFDEYFRDDSEMRIAETGSYKGVDSILEYTKQIAEGYSPYFSAGPIIENVNFSFDGYDHETGLCSFLVMSVTSHRSNGNNTIADVVFSMTSMSRMVLDLAQGYFTRQDVFLPRGFWEVILQTLQDSDNTRRLTCLVMEGVCADIIGIDETTSCSDTLTALPFIEERSDGVLSFEGNTQACRALHASLAPAFPDNHCPHTSFTPLEDLDGKIKCQLGSAANIAHSDLFTDEELETFYEFVVFHGFEREIGTDFTLS